jgi:ABC-type nickel/cobalt efflux system permease component RcnA
MLAALACMLFLSTLAHAHPMGIKLWGHSMTITPRPDAIQLDYTIEVPVTKLAMMMNRFKHVRHIERIGPEDEARFHDEMVEHLISGIRVDLDGQAIPLEWNPNYVRRHSAGQLGFFNYELHLLAPLGPDTDGAKVDIENDNFPVQRAVFHNTIVASPQAYAQDEHLPAADGWKEGEENRRLSLVYRRGEPPPGTIAQGQGKSLGHTRLRDTELLSLLKRTDLSGKVLWIALLSALFLGAAHALSPGHGKALVAAYLVGSRGTMKHAAMLGLIVTLTHIGSVVILGLVGMMLAEYIVPEYYAPFISLASGAMIVGIGAWLFLRRFQSFHRKGHHHHAHEHIDSSPSWRQLLWLGISGGIVPCPSATVVMLTAIAIGKPGMGLLLIAFFSAGLAIVLTLVGMLSVRASNLLARVDRGGRLSQWLPIASSTVVIILGFVIIYRGFWVEWFAWSW